MGRGEGTGAHSHTLAVPCGESLPPQLKLVFFLHIHTIQPPHATWGPCWVQVMLLNVCPLQICQLLADKARPFLEGGPCHWINRSLPRETTTDLLKALNTRSTPMGFVFPVLW